MAKDGDKGGWERGLGHLFDHTGSKGPRAVQDADKPVTEEIDSEEQAQENVRYTLLVGASRLRAAWEHVRLDAAASEMLRLLLDVSR